jgi:ADP-heptose:LPS heptosyltransferase
MLQDKKIKDVHKIALLRANSLGDFIFMLPAAAALRQTYPQAEIVYLARDWHTNFLKDRPSPFDRVIAVPQGGIGDEKVAERPPMDLFFERMVAEKFDLALQMHGGGRNSNPFLLRLGARVTAGARTPDAPLLDRWIPYIYFQLEYLRYLEIVSLVGASPVELEPKIELTPNDLAESFAVVPESKKPMILIHPGASDPTRCWPVEKFAMVADTLAQHGYQIAVTGTGEERVLVEGVISAMREGETALNLCDKLSLNGLTGLLARSALLISNDTGPAHLAGALGTPTVILYWVNNLIMAAPITRLKNRPLVSFKINCDICGQDCITGRCEHNFSLIEPISTQEVLEQAFDLLKMRQPSL